jgi:hypothetical protein
MGVVEDVRQIVQDFLAPELRALVARMDALEKVMDARFTTIDTRFLALDQKLESRFETVNSKLDRLTDALAVDRRLARLEAAQQTPSTPQ